MRKKHLVDNEVKISRNTIRLRNCPDLMTVKDVMKILDIGRSTAYKMLQSGELRALRIGSIYRIPKSYLAEYITNNSSP